MFLLKAGDITEVEYGDIVHLRLGTIQINHHPIHIHGHQFIVEKADGTCGMFTTLIYK